jgi:XFP C-terminal domain
VGAADWGFGSSVRHYVVGAGDGPAWGYGPVPLSIGVVNVVDLATGSLSPGISYFDELFTTDKPVIFAFNGYPAALHS